MDTACTAEVVLSTKSLVPNLQSPYSLGAPFGSAPARKSGALFEFLSKNGVNQNTSDQRRWKLIVYLYFLSKTSLFERNKYESYVQKRFQVLRREHS